MVSSEDNCFRHPYRNKPNKTNLQEDQINDRCPFRNNLSRRKEEEEKEKKKRKEKSKKKREEKKERRNKGRTLPRR